MIRGGWMPAGSWRRMVCDIAVTCALAVSRRACGCRKILTIAWPFTVVDSMCSMLSTVVVRTRSYWVVIRPSISSGLRPVNCQATAITGMSMLGKMSVGVRRMTTGLAIRIKMATTTNVYGRASATLTIHMTWSRDSLPGPRTRARLHGFVMPGQAGSFADALSDSCASSPVEATIAPASPSQWLNAQDLHTQEEKAHHEQGGAPARAHSLSLLP